MLRLRRRIGRCKISLRLDLVTLILTARRGRVRGAKRNTENDMRKIRIAAALAMMLATATPTLAADRPVGPETGQARVAGSSSGGFGSDEGELLGGGPSWTWAFDRQGLPGHGETNLTIGEWFRALGRMFECGIRGINTRC